LIESLVCQLLSLYFIVLIARIILSWFPISPGSGLATVFSLLYAVTEPVLGPLRRLIPPLMLGGAGIDLSPIILFFGIRILQSAICA
jgi:YggT family protein